jgi:hypothetical protein
MEEELSERGLECPFGLWLFAYCSVRMPGVSAPLTVGRRGSGGDGSNGACEWVLREVDSMARLEEVGEEGPGNETD